MFEAEEIHEKLAETEAETELLDARFSSEEVRKSVSEVLNQNKITEISRVPSACGLLFFGGDALFIKLQFTF